MKLGEAFLLDSGEVQGVVVVGKLGGGVLQWCSGVGFLLSFLLFSSHFSVPFPGSVLGIGM